MLSHAPLRRTLSQLEVEDFRRALRFLLERHKELRLAYDVALVVGGEVQRLSAELEAATTAAALAQAEQVAASSRTAVMLVQLSEAQAEEEAGRAAVAAHVRALEAENAVLRDMVAASLGGGSGSVATTAAVATRA